MRSPWTMATFSFSMHTADDTICSLIHHQTNSIFAALTSIYCSIFIYAIRTEAHNEAIDCPSETISPQLFSMQNMDYRILPIFQIQFQLIWINWNEEADGLNQKTIVYITQIISIKIHFWPDLDSRCRFTLTNHRSRVNHFNFQQRDRELFVESVVVHIV